jgi:hypothetical protein
MSKSKTWHLEVKTRVLPDFGGIETLAFPLGIDEDVTYTHLLKYGFIEVTSPAVYPKAETEDMLGIKLVQLDPEFYLREVMNTDPDDTEALLAFMGRYGLLTSPFRVPLVGPMPNWNAQATPKDVTGDSLAPAIESEGKEEAHRVRHELDARHRGAIGNLGFITYDRAYGFAPLWECSETLRWLQDTIRTLVDAKRVGSTADGVSLGVETHNIRALLEEVTSCIGPYFPLVVGNWPDEDRLARGESVSDVPTSIEESAHRPTRLPLTIAILVQLVLGLQADEGFKVCPQCGQVFMFKRTSAKGSTSRRPHSIYCSEACQRAANHARDRRRNHAKKTAKNEEGGQS